MQNWLDSWSVEQVFDRISNFPILVATNRPQLNCLDEKGSESSTTSHSDAPRL